MATSASASTPGPASASPWLEDEPGALSIDTILQQVSQDDQDEWEYEYSTTETEFKERPAKAHHHSRGGYYKNWSDQYTDNLEAKPIKHGPQDSNHNEDDNDKDDGQDNEEPPELEEEALEEGEEENEEDANIDPRLRAMGSASHSNAKKPAKEGKGGKGKGKEKEVEVTEVAAEATAGDEDPTTEPLEEIQILELHSRNPIISYRGRVFEGQWAEVIGTEAILADREAKDSVQLPALRHLPGGVDILGASSSRILTTEKILKPKVVQEDSLAAIREEWNIRIPPGKDRTGERAQQLRFLENLIALKKKRGDKDEVTVYAMDGPGKNFDDRKGPDFKPRRKKPSLGVEQNSEAGQSDIRERRYARRSQGRRGGRRRRASAARGSTTTDRSAAPTLDSNALSTPTPSHWDELLGTHDDEDDNDSLNDIYEDSDGPERRRAVSDEDDEEEEGEDEDEENDDDDVIMRD
ncbi:transcription factor tfiiic, tau55-related [Trichoderma arundinaceum]|uniref:Transcription factor tfiiic, tau55-related n=1 Tax=Trichoderma arundinaceum TaxID=490622 RepID=A0A395NUI1_TRIAR|nr:transcription factor tfiiic, tau55-related [Trichoderma arundinaceum]